MGRLHEATGRPVLTAASGGQSAYEGYKGHGVFTYAAMEALHKADMNSNGKIEVTELAAHVKLAGWSKASPRPWRAGPATMRSRRISARRGRISLSPGGCRKHWGPVRM